MASAIPVSAAALRSAAAADVDAPVRFTPEAVHYQPTPNDWQKCLFCSYFKEPATCNVLSTPVSRNGWCEKFNLLHE